MYENAGLVKWYNSGLQPRRSRAAGRFLLLNIYMYYVYLLKSKKDKGFYIGYSADLKARIKDHMEGLVESTKYRIPLRLIYYESYENKIAAQERERKLKQFGSAYKGLIKRLKLE
jgi:putative endonuclease